MLGWGCTPLEDSGLQFGRSREFQVAMLGRSAYYQQICQPLPFLSENVVNIISYLLLASRPYCFNALYVELALKTVQKFQLESKCCSSCDLFGWFQSAHYSHCTRVTLVTNPFPSQFKVLYDLIRPIYMGTGVLKGHLLHYVREQLLSLSVEGLFQVPSSAEARLVMTRKKTFSMVTCLLWNLLPREAHLSLRCVLFSLCGGILSSS